MNIKDALGEAVNILKKNKIQNPMLKARILLCNVLNLRKEDLIIHDDVKLNKKDEEQFFIDVEKLCQNIPLQYITGKQEFMGESFKVNEYVLIPRYDAEGLVEEVLKCMKEDLIYDILELCTGSGIIAISLAKRRNVNITAVDISDDALNVAKKNAKTHKANVKFIQSNMFKNVEGKFDFIVANPPYIETETLKLLDEEVKKEPMIALDGGADGAGFYRIIEQNAYKYLKKNGCICVEIGYNQRKLVESIFKRSYSNVRCIKDLAGNDRVVIARNLKA